MAADTVTGRHVDVLGLGAVAVDEILGVESFPEVDGKARVTQRQRRCGGLAATALVAAARMGVASTYAGVVGCDESSAFALSELARQRVDVRLARRLPEAAVIRATVVVEAGRGTRTIFFELPAVGGAGVDWPPADLIRRAGVLLVDHVGVPGMLRAARIARAAGVPVVADFEDDRAAAFDDLLAIVDHLIVSQAFAARLTGEAEPARAAQRLWSDTRSVVVVTCGADGAWYIERDRVTSPARLAAFSVQTVDSTGCGDVFHGVYAAALASGVGVGPRLQRAAAAAALMATQSSGQDGIPGAHELDRFIRQQAA